MTLDHMSSVDRDLRRVPGGERPCRFVVVQSGGRRARCSRDTRGGSMDGGDKGEALLDLEHKSNDELRTLLNELRSEEEEISYRRRVLHGRIDILRAELVRRLKGTHDAGEDVISGADIDKLVEILANDLRAARGQDSGGKS
jgi:hypothetical protein